MKRKLKSRRLAYEGALKMEGGGESKEKLQKRKASLRLGDMETV